MRYLSVCSGIEAATVAWHSLGWKPEAFSEIEKFPSQVLAHHYPEVPNLGDMTKFKEWNLGAIDLLVGGTPCQSFSVAGLRKGLDDPRGNLMLTYLAIAEQFKPKWLVWENVPGVLSSNGGGDFGSLLGGLAELGYGFAYRVLDAQYFGVPQRRRRVFVVGCLGDWRAAAAVLFERHSLQGHLAPQREAGKSVAGTVTTSTGKCDAAGSVNGGLIYGAQDAACGLMVTTFDRQSSGEYGTAKVASTVSARDYKGAADLVTYGIQANIIVRQDHNGGNGIGVSEGIAPTLTKADQHGVAVIHGTQDPCSSIVAFALGRNNGQENVLVKPIVFNGRGDGSDGSIDVAPTIRSLTQGADGHQSGSAGIAIVFDTTQITSPHNHSNPSSGEPCHTLNGHSHAPALIKNSQVRRLTPRECERLQGFSDDYTLIPIRKANVKVEVDGDNIRLIDDVKMVIAADGPRYKALGNSMAVPVMHWIGSRIQQVEQIMNAKVAA